MEIKASLLILLVLQAIYNPANAISISKSSYSQSSLISSILDNAILEDNISTAIKVNLLTTSANRDLYYKLQLPFSISEMRACSDCLELFDKPTPISSFNQKIQHSFSCLNDEQTTSIASIFSRVHHLDNKLKRKMFDVNLKDEEILMYGRVREKLTLQLLNYESKLKLEYLKSSNPKQYSKLQSSMNEIFPYSELKAEVEAGMDVPPIFKTLIAEIEGKLQVDIIKLIKSDTEIDKGCKITSFKTLGTDLENYIDAITLTN